MLTRRSLLATPALLIPRKSSAAPRLNVVFIGSDDLNTCLGCYGHPIVKSPNIDRLAASGVRFNRAYCQFPLCGPSRNSLLSGLRPDTTGIFENGPVVRDTVPGVVTLPELFRKNGAYVVRHGKMYHMDVPGSVGTNKYDDPPSWDVSVSPAGLEAKTPGETGTGSPNLGRGNAGRWIAYPSSQIGKQADDGVLDGALEVIHKAAGKPFFLATGFVRPHVPYVAPARFFDLYPLDRLEPVENPPGDVDDIPKASEIAINTRANDMGGMSDRNKRETLRAYFASISYMDSQVGRILDAIEKTNQLDRTVIAFWGDHGYHLGEHHRWHKRSLFEESARVPLIVRVPGRAGNGRSTAALTELVDLYPTIADLCGLRPPPALEGQSFVPLLENPARSWKTAAFTQVAAPDGIAGRGVRTDRYRYVRWTGPYPDEELYDCRSDPREFTNLARYPEKHKATLAEMRTVLDRGWRASMAKV
jgi:uncharacterized sulfatase